MIDFYKSTTKEKNLAIDGTLFVLNIALGIWLSGILSIIIGFYFIYRCWKTIQTPGEVRIKHMIVPSFFTCLFFGLILFAIFSFLGHPNV